MKQNGKTAGCFRSPPLLNACPLPRFLICVPAKTESLLHRCGSALLDSITTCGLGSLRAVQIDSSVVIYGPMVSEGRTRRLLSTNKSVWRNGPFPYSKRIVNS